MTLVYVSLCLWLFFSSFLCKNLFMLLNIFLCDEFAVNNFFKHFLLIFCSLVCCSLCQSFIKDLQIFWYQEMGILCLTVFTTICLSMKMKCLVLSAKVSVNITWHVICWLIVSDASQVIKTAKSSIAVDFIGCES